MFRHSVVVSFPCSVGSHISIARYYLINICITTSVHIFHATGDADIIFHISRQCSHSKGLRVHCCLIIRAIIFFTFINSTILTLNTNFWQMLTFRTLKNQMLTYFDRYCFNSMICCLKNHVTSRWCDVSSVIIWDHYYHLIDWFDEVIGDAALSDFLNEDAERAIVLSLSVSWLNWARWKNALCFILLAHDLNCDVWHWTFVRSLFPRLHYHRSS